mmetsp:Transcript_47730/g.76967  ORF Transcript_47730/g.76967 Transcript_47730/m.76967 type:complete len:249 (-) Transcript_47730:301-1047(-)
MAMPCVMDGKITDLPLFEHGERGRETVLKEYCAPAKCCHCIPCDNECCPAEYCVITNYRILTLKQMHGSTTLSSAFLEDVSAASVGRERPKWKRILFLFLVSIVCLFFGFLDIGYISRECDYSDYDYCAEAKGMYEVRAVFLQLFGWGCMLLALLFYIFRSSAVHFMVANTDGNPHKQLFEIRQGNRVNAIDLVHRYFSLKLAIRQEKLLPPGRQNAPPAPTETVNRMDDTYGPDVSDVRVNVAQPFF